MKAQVLIDTARTLVAGDKGVLAMDESHPTCNTRFAKLGIPRTALAIQYGGSIKPENAAALLSRHSMDGAHIGGTSLNADQFLPIIRAGIDEPQPKGESA